MYIRIHTYVYRIEMAEKQFTNQFSLSAIYSYILILGYHNHVKGFASDRKISNNLIQFSVIPGFSGAVSSFRFILIGIANRIETERRRKENNNLLSNSRRGSAKCATYQRNFPVTSATGKKVSVT